MQSLPGSCRGFGRQARIGNHKALDAPLEMCYFGDVMNLTHKESRMQLYEPAAPFSKIAQEPWAVNLWEFLNTDESIIRMETAIDLKRAPLEGVLKWVEYEFADHISGKENHARRQMVGHMVGQAVNNRLGAQHRNQRTTIRREGSDFKSATKFEFTGATAFGSCQIRRDGCTANGSLDAVHHAVDGNDQPIWVCRSCKSQLTHKTS